MPSRRIWNHPVLEFRRGRRITIYFDDQPLEAYEGEVLAAALYGSGVDVLRLSHRLGRPRGPFCMMGRCSSCVVRIDGGYEKACTVKVRDGLRAYHVEGLPELPPVQGAGGGIRKVSADAVIVGAGPAGVAAAEVLGTEGVKVVLVDEGDRIGGQLNKQTHRFFGSRELFAGLRGYQIAEIFRGKLEGMDSVEILPNTLAFGMFEEGLGLASEKGVLAARFKALLVATGASENFLAFENNDLPGVMGAGGAQTLMNLYGVRPGDRVLIVGSGNVGLIVAYQLLQAGSEVVGIVEAMPEIGGWLVHACKVRRYGVPILVGHTIVRAHGEYRVRGATIARLGDHMKVLPGTERYVECDTILLAVGLSPNTELLMQAGVPLRYVPELGGLVALRTRYLETPVEGIFVAGDASGVEEATTAFLEGRLAAYSMLIRLRGPRKRYIEARERLLRTLDEYRMSPASARVRAGWSRVLVGVRRRA